MGAVYVASDANLEGHLVAIKENGFSEPQAQSQFAREANLLARLRHSNLPRVTNHFVEKNDRQYLVMDYIAGEDLVQVSAKQNGPLLESDVLVWMHEILNALEYMHDWIDPQSGQAQPIIHRDIKPGNIKRTPDDEIFLVDFGLVRLRTDESMLTGARGHTPGYSPIEQTHGGTDARSDIYSLGATMYKLLTGETPLKSSEIAAGQSLVPPCVLNPQISRHVEQVILKAMALQSNNRFQSAVEMRQALTKEPWQNLQLNQGLSRPTDFFERAEVMQSIDKPVFGSWLPRIGLALMGILFIGLFPLIFDRINSPQDVPTSQVIENASSKAIPLEHISLADDIPADEDDNSLFRIQIPTPTATPWYLSTPVPTATPTFTNTPTETPTIVPIASSTSASAIFSYTSP